MDLHLNDWSLSCSTHLGKQWHVISQFGELTNVLRTYGIDKIVFPTNYKGINIGGIQWKDCYTPSEELTKDQWDELMAIMDKSIRKPYPEEINESRIFSNNNDFEKYSTFLGNAFFLDLPVVSFTEHEDFHFELCDHKGYHLKEIHHSGKVTSGPQDHHCIRI